MYRDVLLRLIFSLLLGTVIFAVAARNVDAAFLFFDPSEKTVKPDGTVEILLRIDTEGATPLTVDSDIEIVQEPEDAFKIELVELDPEDRFFPQFFQRGRSYGGYVGGAIKPGTQPIAGVGDIAIYSIQALSDVGKVTFSLRCKSGSTTESNITLKRDKKPEDIIDCAKVKGSTIVISEADAITPVETLTPTASPTPVSEIEPGATLTPTPYPTPSALPETGMIEVVGYGTAIGILLIVGSIVIKLLI